MNKEQPSLLKNHFADTRKMVYFHTCRENSND